MRMRGFLVQVLLDRPLANDQEVMALGRAVASSGLVSLEMLAMNLCGSPFPDSADDVEPPPTDSSCGFLSAQISAADASEARALVEDAIGGCSSAPPGIVTLVVTQMAEITPPRQRFHPPV